MAPRITRIGFTSIITVTGLLTFGGMASAAFTAPGWTRPASDAAAAAGLSTYQAWNTFNDDDLVTAGIQDNVPDEAEINPNGATSLLVTGLNSVASSGNLYSPTDTFDLAFTIPGHAPVAGASTRFLVQIKTLGSELVRTNPGEPTPVYDFTRFSINGTLLTNLTDFTYTELPGRSTVPSLGDVVEHQFLFTLPMTAASYQFAYGLRSSSSSQDRITIDTLVAVPEPAAATLGALAAAGGLLSRRRRAL